MFVLVYGHEWLSGSHGVWVSVILQGDDLPRYLGREGHKKLPVVSVSVEDDCWRGWQSRDN